MLRKFRRWRRLSVRAKFGLVIAAFIASLSFIQMAAGWLSGETNGSISKTMTKVRDFLERMQIIRFTETQPWISYCGMTVFVFSVVVLIYDWLASRHNSRLVSAGTPAIGNPSDRPHLTALAETLARASERSIGDLAEMHLRERAEAKKQKSSTALTDTQTTQNLNPPSVSPASQSDSAPLDIPRIRAAVEYCTAPVLAFHELFAKKTDTVEEPRPATRSEQRAAAVRLGGFAGLKALLEIEIQAVPEFPSGHESGEWDKWVERMNSLLCESCKPDVAKRFMDRVRSIKSADNSRPVMINHLRGLLSILKDEDLRDKSDRGAPALRLETARKLIRELGEMICPYALGSFVAGPAMEPQDWKQETKRGLRALVRADICAEYEKILLVRYPKQPAKRFLLNLADTLSDTHLLS